MLEILIKIFTHPLAIKAAVAVIGIIIISFIFKIIKAFASKHIMTPEKRYHTRKFITYMGYIAIFIFLLAVFYERLRGVTIAFGLIGAGIAFSLQRVIASIAGWIAISSQHFYTVGDRIQIGNIKGDVVDINVLRTAIMEIGEWVDADLYTGRLIWISNGSVFDTAVYNYSGSFPYLWDQVKIPIKYGSNHILAQEIMYKVINDVVKDYIDDARESWKTVMRKFVVKKARIEPYIGLETTDNWIEFTIRYVVNYDKRLTTKNDLFTRILEEFNKTNGQISFASQTVQIVGIPPINLENSQ